MGKNTSKKLDHLSATVDNLVYIHGLIINNSDPFDPEFRLDLIHSLTTIVTILQKILKELESHDPKNTSG